jgi:enoyl-CoA hydratase/carnithine racemase
LHCDLGVAADAARFRLPFAELGLAPEAAASVLLPARVGQYAAAHMLFTGTWISATEAAAAGLVWRVVDAAGLADAAAGVAGTIATAPLASLVATKQSLVAGRAAAVDRALRYEQDLYRHLLAGPDVAAALARFRTPG